MALPALDVSYVNDVRSRRRNHVSIDLNHKVGRLLPACSDRLHRVPQTRRRESAEANDSGLEEDASIPFVWFGIFDRVVICRWIIVCGGEVFCCFSHDELHTCIVKDYQRILNDSLTIAARADVQYC